MSSSTVVDRYAPAFFALMATQLADRIVDEGGRAAKRHGLVAPVRAYSTLLALAEESRSVTEIAAQLGLTHAAVIKQVRPLIEEGLLERSQDQNDARRRPLQLTARGTAEVALIAEFMAAAQQVYAAIFAEIGTDLDAAVRAFAAALDRSPFDARMSALLEPGS